MDDGYFAVKEAVSTISRDEQRISILPCEEFIESYDELGPIKDEPRLHEFDTDEYTRITVHGIVIDPFNVTDAVVESLLKYARTAPFGKGHDTIVDRDVRDALEIEAQHISVHGLYIHDAIGTLDDIYLHEATLYKMHIYGPGGHFQPHLDSRHSEDHVGTLVIALNTPYTGGDLVIDGKVIDLHSAPNALVGCTFYTDVEHHVTPVTSGVRIVLQYDITRGDLRDGATMFVAVNSDVRTEGLISNIVSRVDSHPDSHQMLMCSHKYSLNSMDPTGTPRHHLKGSDLRVWDRLVTLYPNSVVVPLVIVTNLNSDGACLGEGYDSYFDAYIAPAKIWKYRENFTCDVDSLILVPWVSHDSFREIESSPFIEHTGNSSQDAEFIYFASAFVVIK